MIAPGWLTHQWRDRDRFLILIDAQHLNERFAALQALWEADPQHCERLHVVSLREQVADTVHRTEACDGRVTLTVYRGDPVTVVSKMRLSVDALWFGEHSAADLRLLQWGLSLDGKALKPARVTWQNEDQLRFILKEGRKRQIRRMCELVGLEVLGLKRVRIGLVRLGELPLGQWRLLASDETFA